MRVTFRSMIAFCYALLVAGGAVAAEPEIAAAANEKHATYIMVVKDERHYPPPADGKKPKRPEEPEIAKFGGKELGRWGTRRVVRIPVTAIERLSKHVAVLYLALVNTGERPEGPRIISASSTAPDVASDATIGPPEWDSGPYAYDASGNIISVGTDSYSYDSLQRLQTATTSGTTVSYGYDGFGNRNSSQWQGQGQVTVPVNSSNNRLTNVPYDEAGNQVQSTGAVERYAWDSAGMMTNRWPLAQSAFSWRYLYTADDERIATQGLDDWSWTIRDLDGKVLTRFESPYYDFTYWQWSADFFYRDGQLSAAERPGPEGGRRFYHADHLGTPRLITNRNTQKIAHYDFYAFGMAQSPFNAEETTAGYPMIPTQLVFTGHERDYANSGDPNVHTYLDYMHARYYSPALGRFLSVDPVLDLKRSTREPQSWNRYSYVVNNPINRIDPDGRMDGNGMGEPAEWRCPGCTRAEQLEQSNQIAKGTLIGGALSLAVAFGGPPAWKAAGGFLFRHLGATTLAMTLLGGGTHQSLQRAAQSGGPTVQLVTNLTQAPAAGRALSAAAGEGAQALATAARSGEGVRTFAAQIPQALIKGLEAAKLLRISTTQMNGVQATEYRFAPGAAEYITKFFKEVK